MNTGFASGASVPQSALLAVPRREETWRPYFNPPPPAPDFAALSRSATRAELRMVGSE